MYGLPSRLSVRHLEVLRELGRASTWTEAADSLGLAQSTVSQAVGRVEELAGLLLFEPVGVRRAPTPAGTELIALAERVLADVAATWEEVQHRERSGVLRVGVIDAAALYLLPRRFAGFARLHPEVDVRLTVDVSDALMARLVDRSLDVAVVTGPQPGFVSEEVASEDLRMYGRSGDASACVLYPDGSRTRRLIDEGLRRLGIRPEVVATASNPAVLRELARLGAGWTVLPEAVAEEPGREPLHPIGEVVAARSIVAVRRHAGVDPLADAFVATLA